MTWRTLPSRASRCDAGRSRLTAADLITLPPPAQIGTCGGPPAPPRPRDCVTPACTWLGGHAADRRAPGCPRPAAADAPGKTSATPCPTDRNLTGVSLIDHRQTRAWLPRARVNLQEVITKRADDGAITSSGADATRSRHPRMPMHHQAPGDRALRPGPVIGVAATSAMAPTGRRPSIGQSAALDRRRIGMERGSARPSRNAPSSSLPGASDPSRASHQEFHPVACRCS
jgi:hypothetical protein